MKRIIDSVDTLGIIGLSKNSGKTTTLNAILELYRNLRIGLTSIGLDGEDLDQVNFLPKPKIFVRRGMVVATASGCLEASKVNFQVLEITGMRTALGHIEVVEILSDGNMVIAGPTTNRELNQVIQLMKKRVDKIFIDGAFNRMTFANIESIDAIVLATGAAESPIMSNTIEKAKMIVDFFNLKKSYRLEEIPKQPMIIQTTFNQYMFEDKKIMSLKHLFTEVNDKIDWLYIKGAITPKYVHYFTQKLMSDFTLICDDPTKLLIDKNDFLNLKKLRIEISTIHPCPLLFVTINPFSPSGNHYDEKAFKKAMEDAIKIPVYNVLKMEEEYV
ncbi:MAG: hypothetical protein CVV58_00600 [Tenericutes bacterium HGW-Tenericutes-3]|nr:MAG: hypothetical protein CVV58_00600 [Tenericutes bacterium HGW-Tenericutes-3]